MNQHLPSTKIINIRVIAAKENIDEIITKIVDDLSLDFELLKQSKPYSSRQNPNEVRIYLEFIKHGGAAPGAYDAVKGSN